MTSPTARAAGLAIAASALLAACAASIGPNPVRISSPSGDGSRTAAGSKISCTAPYVNVPGDYIVVESGGNFRNGRYVSSGTFSTWNEVRYEAGGSIPTASPKPPVPEYVYYGTYSLDKHRQKGCAFLFVSQNGQPFPGLTDNALTSGAPIVKVHFHVKVLPQEGPLSVRLDRLSASGGTGSMTLTQGGSVYDTGKIDLVGRAALP